MAEIIDREALAARMMGDAALADRILDAFRDDLPRRLSTAREVLDRGDGEALKIEAHTIVGAARSAGATALAAAAEALERAARDGEFEEAARHLEVLGNEFARLERALDRD